MRLKIHPKDRCPRCGRIDASQRIRRGWFIRRIRPDTSLMQCRLCLTRYLVRQQQELQIQRD